MEFEHHPPFTDEFDRRYRYECGKFLDGYGVTPYATFYRARTVADMY
jgi:hypothetical protein